MKLYKNLHRKLILKKLKKVRNAFLLYVLVDTSYSFSKLFKFLRISVLKDELSKFYVKKTLKKEKFVSFVARVRYIEIFFLKEKKNLVR